MLDITLTAYKFYLFISGLAFAVLCIGAAIEWCRAVMNRKPNPLWLDLFLHFLPAGYSEQGKVHYYKARKRFLLGWAVAVTWLPALFLFPSSR
jgi:hypothetical protein